MQREQMVFRLRVEAHRLRTLAQRLETTANVVEQRMTEPTDDQINFSVDLQVNRAFVQRAIHLLQRGLGINE